mgnify:CR=1 FL=1
MSLVLQGILGMPLPDDPKDIDLVTYCQLKDALHEAAKKVALLDYATDFRIAEDVIVTWRGGDAWAIKTRFGHVYGKDGEWYHEPSPSNRTDEFLANTRYGRDEAIEVALRLKEMEYE